MEDRSGGFDHLKSKKNDQSSKGINASCKDINKVALNGQGREQWENLLGEMRKTSSFSTVNTIRFPVQQQKQHLRAGEASHSWITDHFRYDALINRWERVSTWKGRGFPKTQSWFKSSWLPEQCFPSWISLAYTLLRWQQREYNIVLTHTSGELHAVFFIWLLPLIGHKILSF